MFVEIMKKELELELVKLAPNLYRDYSCQDFTKSLMGFGFCCPDEWFPILRHLSIQLETKICSLPIQQRKNCKVVQVKEKFGNLCFYFENFSQDMINLIQEAEKKVEKLRIKKD